VSLVVAAAPLAGYADSTNASAKVSLETSYLNVLGLVTNSTAGFGPITTEWQTVLEQDIKMANDHDLIITAAFEVGLYTNASFTATGLLGKGTMTADSVRVVKVPPYPYILPME
jgi:hypothetical protein